MKNKKVVKEDNIKLDTRDNRTRAQALIDEIKQRNKKLKFVRIPIEFGYKEIEVGKYERLCLEGKIKK